MPFISYSTVEGALSDEQKRDLCTAITDAVAKTLGEKLRPNVWIVMNEAPEGSFYIGGNALKATSLKRLME